MRNQYVSVPEDKIIERLGLERFHKTFLRFYEKNKDCTLKTCIYKYSNAEKWAQLTENEMLTISHNAFIKAMQFIYKDIDVVAEDISDIIASKINEDGYIIFRHSRGSLLTFEVYYKLLRNRNAPKTYIFSGKDAPHLKCNHKKIHEYDDDEKFLNMISLYGGMPDEF